MLMCINIQKIPEYLDYMFYKAWADLCAEARRYYISYIWWVLSPILEMLVYYVVFGIGLKGFKTENFMIFLLIGVVAWKWVETSAHHCTLSIYKNRNIIKLVYLPKIIFPLIDICTDTFKFIIAFTVFVLIINLSGMFISKAYLALPMVFLTQLLFIISVGILFSAITPFFPDFELFAEYAIRLLFFISGIFFDARQLSDKYNFLFNLNPMTRIVDAYRDIIMRGQMPKFYPLVIISILSLCFILILSAWVFKLDKTYPKVLAE
jgi:lipopolysaccharide transport system permease protein